MNGMDFLYLINNIDDDLIENASEISLRRKGSIIKPLLFAACLGAAVAAIILYLGLSTHDDEIRKTVNVTEETQTEPVVMETDTQEETTAIINGPELIVSDNLVIITGEVDSDLTEGSDNITVDQGAMVDTTLTVPYVADELIDQGATEEDSIISDPYITDEPAETEPIYYEPPTEETVPEQPVYRVIDIMWGFSEDAADPYSTPEDMTLFWQESGYDYYMNAQILWSAAVLYDDGSYESILEALSNGHIGIYDLDTYGIPYYTE